MADFQSTTTVNADPAVLFDYLSDVGNLPHYFARMTSARPGDGEEVHTTAQMPDGTEVAGAAWFRADLTDRRIAWGAEGPNDYHGSLQVTDIRSGSGPGAEVMVRLHTTRVGDTTGIQDGLDATLSTIKRLVEEQYAIT